ncbi:hypothetical protein [Streptomyces sp. NPDC003943]
MNGKLVKVPPHSPAIKLLEHAAMVVDADTVAIRHVQDTMRREACRAVGQVAETALTQIDGFREPGPLRSRR